MSKKLVIIAKIWPEPSSSASGSRLLQLIQCFRSAGWIITLTSPAKESEFSFDFRSLHITCFQIELNHRSFDSFIVSCAPDAVLFDRFSTEEQFGWRVAEQCPQALRILDTEDLHCLRATRELAVKANKEFSFQDLKNSTLAKREIASIYRSDLSLIISEFEMKVLKEVFLVPNDLLVYVPFLLSPVNLEDQKKWLSFSERKGFISIGNFLHAPNTDAVRYLKNTIWPIIKNKLPEAELSIYGAYPTQEVLQWHHPKSGFLIKGRAEQVDQVMQAARVCLAPLRFGAGLKGKLIDAMKNGTPNITSSIGAESMHGNEPWCGMICDDPEKFAEAAVTLYLNEKQWHQSQNAGLEIIRHHFNAKDYSLLFLERINYLLPHLQNHRDENFIGAMLNQHSTSSTKYMALWIEAKNKLNQKKE